MKRRGFLGALLGLPALPVAVATIANEAPITKSEAKPSVIEPKVIDLGEDVVACEVWFTSPVFDSKPRLYVSDCGKYRP